MKRRRFLSLTAAAPAGWLVGRHVAGGETVREEPGPQVTWSRKVPVRYEADVAVLGGGIAGVSAACAAARSGASVVLVERFAITGGDLTSGGVANFCGETKGQGEVFDAIVADLDRFQALAPYRAAYPDQTTRVFDHHILALVLQELLLRRGVRLLLHTRFVDVSTSDDGRITEAIVCGKSGPEALRARQFVDCTGEADVARAAGFATVKGRLEDGLQLPMSIHCFVRHVEPKDVNPPLPDGWFQPIRRRDDLPMTSVWPNGPRGNSLKIKIPKFDSTDTESFTAAEIAARRRAMEVLAYYQQVEGKAWRYDGCSPQIGIREGARVVGDYVLTVDDLRAGRVLFGRPQARRRQADLHLAKGSVGRAAVSDSIAQPDRARRGEPAGGGPMFLGRPACAFLGPGEHYVFDDGAGGGDRRGDERRQEVRSAAVGSDRGATGG